MKVLENLENRKKNQSHKSKFYAYLNDYINWDLKMKSIGIFFDSIQLISFTQF